MGKEGPKDKTRDGFKRANLGKESPNFGKAGPKEDEMVSREPTWAKKVLRIN